MLEQVYDLLKKGGGNDWTAEDIRVYNEEIDEAMKRMDEGHFVTHEDVVKELELMFR